MLCIDNGSSTITRFFVFTRAMSHPLLSSPSCSHFVSDSFAVRFPRRLGVSTWVLQNVCLCCGLRRNAVLTDFAAISGGPYATLAAEGPKAARLNRNSLEVRRGGWWSRIQSVVVARSWCEHRSLWAASAIPTNASWLKLGIGFLVASIEFRPCHIAA